MGTRADFYLKYPEKFDYIGSISWDGYPDNKCFGGLEDVDNPRWFVYWVLDFLVSRDDSTIGAYDKWPWPWKTSKTTDFTYAFDVELNKVLVSGYLDDVEPESWFIFKAKNDNTEEDLYLTGLFNKANYIGRANFPDMSKYMNLPQLGSKRSGLIAINKGI